MTFSIHKRGFSLVELLVVIAIIGVLATMVLAVLGNSRKTARDTKRINDLRQLRTALDAYYLKKGNFPCNTGAQYMNSQSHCLSLIVPKYIPELPLDPVYGPNGSTDSNFQDYIYYSNSSQNYYFASQFEDIDSVPVTHQNTNSSNRCSEDSSLPVPSGIYMDRVFRDSSCDRLYYVVSSQVSS